MFPSVSSNFLCMDMSIHINILIVIDSLRDGWEVGGGDNLSDGRCCLVHND